MTSSFEDTHEKQVEGNLSPKHARLTSTEAYQYWSDSMNEEGLRFS